ncbi:MAG: hypothetical protein ACKOPG_07710 [Novosphingobium sp.]
MLAAVLFARCAQAGEPVPPSEAAITVTGVKQDLEQVRREAAAFVRKTGVASGQTPAARWIDPVCPKVIGLPGHLANRVETQLRDIAQGNGVPVARAKCRSNVVVVFTDDARKLIGTIASRQPQSLAEVPVSARPALKTGPAPVRWWYTTGVRSKDGVRAATAPPPWFMGDGNNGGGSPIPMDGDTTTLVQTGTSIVSTQTVRAFSSATVVIDVNLADGKTLDAVTDFAALVAFAEIRPSPSPPDGTILALFEPGGDLAGLTERDAAFLKALYRLPLDRQAHQQRGRLVDDLVSARLADD